MSYARKRRLELIGAARTSCCALSGRDIAETEDAFLQLLTMGPLFAELFEALADYVQGLPPSNPLHFKSLKLLSPRPSTPSTPADACALLGTICRAHGVPEQAVPSFRDLLNEPDVNRALLTFPLLQKQYPSIRPATPRSVSSSSPSGPPVSSPSPSPSPSPSHSASALPIASNPSYNRKDPSLAAGERNLQRGQDRKQRDIDEQLAKEAAWREERGPDQQPPPPPPPTPAKSPSFPRPPPPSPSSSADPQRPASFSSPTGPHQFSVRLIKPTTGSPMPPAAVSSPVPQEPPCSAPRQLPDCPELDRSPARPCLRSASRSAEEKTALLAKQLRFAPEPPKLERRPGAGVQGFVGRKQQEQTDNIAARLAARQQRLEEEAKQQEQEQERERERERGGERGRERRGK